MRTKMLVAVTAAGAALTVLIVSSEAAQRDRVSPHESVTATVHGATLTITYGRPSVRGRAIFGALVPYGTVWCPGADEATTLDSDKALRFGTLTVPPGPHTIWMLPTAGEWTLVVSKESSGFHTRYHPDADLGRVVMRKAIADGHVEQLTFAIQPDKTPPTGTITMAWDTTVVSAPFSVVQ